MSGYWSGTTGSGLTPEAAVNNASANIFDYVENSQARDRLWDVDTKGFVLLKDRTYENDEQAYSALREKAAADKYYCAPYLDSGRRYYLAFCYTRFR